MRQFTIVFALFFLTNVLHAQVVGKGKLISKTYDLETFYAVNVNINYDITVDMDAPAGVTIVAQSNIIDLIGKEVEDEILTIDQVRWIEATRPIAVTIGAPELQEVYTDSHSTLTVHNVQGEIFKVGATLGKVVLDGTIAELRIVNESSSVDASALMAEQASVNVSEDGNVLLNVTGEVDCNVADDGTIRNINTDTILPDNCIGKQVPAEVNKDVKYIDLKIKNNSWSRKHFVVVGPKPTGGPFSYGFAMMPGSVKSERWTTGTKVYQESRDGRRKLLVELTEKSEGQTVKLFD